MIFQVLVVSAAAGFSELIEITLREEQQYEPVSVSSGAQALQYIAQKPVDYCILDSDVTDLALTDLADALHVARPKAHLIVIPPDNDPQHPALQGVDFDEVLTKPFYIPDLIRMLNRLSPASELEAGLAPPEDVPAPESPTEQKIPEWLGDVNRAAQHLMRLSLESSAHAALIVRDGKLWAYAGQLPQAAAQELAQQLATSDTHPITRPGSRPLDVARFAHLKSTDSDYMLYATGLTGDILLALAFDAAMPFTKMRTQAADLARALSDLPAAPVFVEAGPARRLPARSACRPEYSHPARRRHPALGFGRCAAADPLAGA